MFIYWSHLEPISSYNGTMTQNTAPNKNCNMNYLDKKETVGIFEISPDYPNKVTAIMQLLCPTSTNSAKRLDVVVPDNALR